MNTYVEPGKENGALLFAYNLMLGEYAKMSKRKSLQTEKEERKNELRENLVNLQSLMRKMHLYVIPMDDYDKQMEPSGE